MTGGLARRSVLESMSVFAGNCAVSARTRQCGIWSLTGNRRPRRSGRRLWMRRGAKVNTTGRARAVPLVPQQRLPIPIGNCVWRTRMPNSRNPNPHAEAEFGATRGRQWSSRHRGNLASFGTDLSVKYHCATLKDGAQPTTLVYRATNFAHRFPGFQRMQIGL